MSSPSPSPSDSPFPSDMAAAFTCPPLPVMDGLAAVLKVLTPKQMVALLRCSRSGLAMEVRAKFDDGTVNPGPQDYVDLREFGLVMKQSGDRHDRHNRLTRRGAYCLDLLARALARDLKIKIRLRPRVYTPDGYTVPQSTW